jgi:hypothetical protein
MMKAFKKDFAPKMVFVFPVVNLKKIELKEQKDFFKMLKKINI